MQVAAVPVSPSGSRLEIYGRDGALVLASAGALSTGPNRIFGVQGRGTVAELTVPDEYTLVPEGTPAGPPRNVGQAYAALHDSWSGAATPLPDFDRAVTRHRLIDAIERSAREGRAIAL